MPTVIIESGQGNIVSNVRNAAGGLAVVNSGTVSSSGINRIAAYFTDVGMIASPTVTVYESGGTVNAVRTADGVIISSGVVWDEVMRVAVLEAADSTNGGTILIKAGTYSVESGVQMSGGIRIIGEGRATSIQVGGLGATSGIFKFGADVQELHDMDIQTSSGQMLDIYIPSNNIYTNISNVILDGSTKASGSKGILIAGGSDIHITDMKNIENFDTGIYLLGTGARFNKIDACSFNACNVGVRVDGGQANTITNIMSFGESSGVVYLESGAQKNIVSDVIGRSTSVFSVRVRFSGIENYISNISNLSGGTATALGASIILQDPARNEIGTRNYHVGVSIEPQWTIWESGGSYFTKRTADLLTRLSNFAAEIIFNEVTVGINAIGGGVALVKNGTYNFNSGVVMPPNGVFIGEGQNTELNFSAVSGRVSGCLDFGGSGQVFKNFRVVMQSGCYTAIHGQANSNWLTIENVTVEGPGSSVSGTKAIQIEASQNNVIKNVEISAFDMGIQMVSGPGATPTTFGNFVDTVTFRSDVNTGILLDNVYNNSISNIHHTNPLSGCIVLQTAARRNTIANVISDSTTIPGVVIKASGINNTITNILNSSGGPPVWDLTSGCTNYIEPGTLAPAELISGTSAFTYTNASGRKEMISITAGTVSQIDFIRAGTTTTFSGATAGQFILDGGDKLTITYSSAPSIRAIPI